MSTFGRIRDLLRSNLTSILEPEGDTTLDDELWERPRDAARSRPPRPEPPADTARRSQPPRQAPVAPPVIDPRRVEELYLLLEVPVGGDLVEVKRGFRRLMRLHHPDLQQPAQPVEPAAIERVQELIAAYNELCGYLRVLSG